jgi:hypothetical protein
MEKHTGMREIKSELNKILRYKNKNDFEVAVKIYDCDESGEQTYDVEVFLYDKKTIENGYHEVWVTDVAYGDEELKLAKKRSKAVLKMIQVWFNYSDVTVRDEIELYHA